MQWLVPLFVVILTAGAALALAPSRRALPETFGIVGLHQGDDPAWAQLSYDDRSWRKAYWRSADPQGRLVWLRAYVTIPRQQALDRPIAVHVAALASYELYWNGELIGRSGVPGASRSREAVGPVDGDFPISHERVRTGQNLLALRMSTFHLPFRVVEPLQKLSVAELTSGVFARTRAYLLSIFAAGTVLLAGLLLALMRSPGRKDARSISLTLAAAAYLVQLGIESARAWIDYPYDWQLWRLGSVSAAAALFGVFITRYAATGLSRRVIRTVLAMPALWSLIALVCFVSWDDKLAALVCGSFVIAASVAWLNSDISRRSAAAAVIVAGIAIMGAAVSPSAFDDQHLYILSAVLVGMLAFDELTLMRVAPAAAEGLPVSKSWNRISVLSARGTELLELDSVLVVRGADDYAEIETTSGMRRLHRARLSDLERQLPSHFRRVHRSNIVNLDHVRELISRPSPCLRMDGGLLIPVSRSYRPSLKVLFEGSTLD